MYPMMFPMFPMIPNLYKLKNDYDMPPTLYSILNSIVNFDNPNPVKIKDLANAGRNKIFDFDYDLSNSITKEKFECMILNHFMQRRIGFETVTAFKLHLNVKINEIMPYYNKLLDSIESWNIFQDGELTTRDISSSSNGSNSTTGNTSSSNTTTSSDTSDRRYSKTPQNKINEVRSGNYLTDYNYDQSSGTDTSSSTSSNSISGTDTNSSTSHETVSHTPADKMNNYIEYLSNQKKIFTMIFDDLESLFYQIV